jgi:hypothetical protein
MPEQRAFVRYDDSIEQRSPDEDETIGRIIASMTRESEITAGRYHHAVRASHAKSTGLLKGELRVLPGLPPFLRQGLFAEPRSYPVLVRLAQGPGELLSDSVSTHRGMAIKVFGAEGPKIAGHEGNDTQDFVLATGPAFPQADAASFLLAMRALEAGTPMPEAVKQAVSTTARVAQSAVKAVGGPDLANLEFFGHTPRHPLADRYYSQAALRYGEHVAKVGVFPASRELNALGDGPLDRRGNPDGFREAVVEFFHRSPAEFDFRVQLCTDLRRMPVEDASVRWPEAESSYLSVARLTLPKQEAHSPARRAFFDDVLAFRPAHSLEAHRPLGSLMRARLKTYAALSAFRHGRNGVPEREPRSIEEVPP